MKNRLTAEAYLHLVVLYLVWGSTFLVIRVTLHDSSGGLPPFLLADMRVTGAGLILLALAAIFRDSLSLTWSAFLRLIVTGNLLWVGGHALVIWGEQKMHSSYAALLFGSMPLWALLFEALFFRDRKLTRGLVLSAFVGFLGIVILSFPSLQGGWQENLPSLLALIAAPACWALGTLLQNDEIKQMPALTSAGYQQVFGGLGCAVLAFYFRENMPAWDASVFVGLVYLTLIGSVMAFGSYTRAMQLMPVNWVMSFAYVNPVVAVFLGWLILGEPVTASVLAGMAFIILGVLGLFRFG